MAIFESYQHFDLRTNRRNYSSTRQAWDWRKTYLGRRNNSKQSTQEDRTGNESNSWDKSQTSRLEWNDQPSWNSSFEVSQGANNWSRLLTMSNNKSIATETEEQEIYSFRPIGATNDVITLKPLQTGGCQRGLAAAVVATANRQRIPLGAVCAG